MVAAGVAAILALAMGVVVGRSIIPSTTETKQPDPVRFVDSAAGVSLTYPGSWRRLPSTDTQVRLLADNGPSRALSLSLRVTGTEIKDVKEETLPVVREFTDSLISEDQRATMLSAPEPVSLGGMVGYRYRYNFTSADGSAGSHVHYFMFNGGKLIQLVFQAVPATRLTAAEPKFEQIAGTLRSTER